jgi:hypothetical protein
MLSSSYFNLDNKRKSKDTLDFLSYTIEGLFENLMNIRSYLRSYIAKQTLIIIVLFLKAGCITKGIKTIHSLYIIAQVHTSYSRGT